MEAMFCIRHHRRKDQGVQGYCVLSLLTSFLLQFAADSQGRTVECGGRGEERRCVVMFGEYYHGFGVNLASMPRTLELGGSTISGPL